MASLLLSVVGIGKIEKVPVVLFGREFWDGAVNWDHFVREGTIDPDDLDAGEEAFDSVVPDDANRSHRAGGRS